MFTPLRLRPPASLGRLVRGIEEGSRLINFCHFYFLQFKYGKISSKHNGSVKKGVIFATYSSLIGESQSGGKYKTRLKQLLHWCGEDFDGVVSFFWSSFDYNQIAI